MGFPMGLRAQQRLPLPLLARVRPADLVRLCPGCDTPLADAPPSGAFAVLACRACGLSVMTPRERRRTPRD